ncbi:Panacea domain-containing protein [Stenotrophomonas sp. AB1(2024)]|uniref:Panacea domain-containing protein n=1 Tax=Stenotrophomonas sp. AB1(2024) TaxID=3132215 RepID=UPI0030965F72
MLKSHTEEKFVQAILYFAHSTQALGKIKLFKLLFLLDFEHFRQTGRSVTGLEYRAWRMGPVPAALVQQWDQLEEGLRDAIRIVPEQVITYWREKVVPLQPFDASHFSKRELRLLEAIAQEYRETLSDAMIDMTHAENGAWAKTWQEGAGNDRVIEYRLAVPDDASDRDAVLDAADLYAGIAAAQRR